MSDPLIQTETDGQILHVILNRPEKRNALTPQMVHDLAAAVRQADDDPQLRAVVISGRGSIFCAGIDIMSLAGTQAELGQRNPARMLRLLAQQLQQSLDSIESIELPVIMALHGQVMGLGLELALAGDFRVADEGLKLSIPESRIGLVADVGGTTRLSRTVGPSRAKDMLMTARAIETDEALNWGLVNRVVPAGEHLAGAVKLAEEIAKNAPLAVGMAKLIVDQGDGLDKHTQMAIERWAQSQLITTDDMREAMTAFAEKREPKFKGQ